jgi:hypothetical protein
MTRHDAHAIRWGMLPAALLVPLLVQPAAGQPAARPPADAARSVTLPLAEYNRLLDLASRPPAEPPAAPVAATLAAADIRVRADEAAVRGTIAIQGDVLRTGNQRVPLVTGATLLDASTTAGPLPLVAEGGVHSALLPGPAPFAVTLEWGAPLTYTRAAPPSRCRFPPPGPLAPRSTCPARARTCGSRRG